MARTVTDMRALPLLLLMLLASPIRAELQVFACEPEWAALTKALVPDADITTATTHLQDPHYIEARPSLIAAMRGSDIAVCTGASLESGWLPMLLQRAANPEIQEGRPGLFYASEHTSLYSAHDHVDRSLGDVHPEGDPHVHLDPARVPEIAGALMERLRELNPEQSAAIYRRYVSWRANWIRQRHEWLAVGHALEGKSVVVQHSSFGYLLRWLGVEAPLDLEPKPGLPPSAAHLGQLKSDPALERAGLILIADYQDPQAGEWLSDASGLPLVSLPSTVTDQPQSDTLAELISSIIGQLEEHLGDSRVD